MPQETVNLNVHIPKKTYLALHEYIKRRFIVSHGAIKQVIREALEHYMQTHPPPEKPNEYPKTARKKRKR
ncbi:MAG: hypothetical protein QW734_06150 [Candidatus Bathyarchaeia archaeon]